MSLVFTLTLVLVLLSLQVFPAIANSKNSTNFLSSRKTHARGIRASLPTEGISRSNNELLFVCVVNLQGSDERQARFKRMLEQGILSIAKFYPGADVLIFYGEAGKKPNLKLSTRINIQIEEVKTNVFNTEKEYTSYGRMKAYAEVIANELERSTPRGIIFYDADMLFVGDHFRRVFFSSKHDWAVGLTFRSMRKFPVNCGLMLVSQNNLISGLKFWNEILSSYEKGSSFQGRFIRKEDIVGDQLATCKVIESLGNYYMKPREHVRNLKIMNDTTILLLPTRRWNWTPKPMCYIDSRCAVLHFKGNKKVHMTKASKLLGTSKDVKTSNIFRQIAKLGQDPRSTRKNLKKNCSD